MIKYTNSNVFNTNATAIVNTINCVGFMGKGLAFEFSLRYPKMLDDYKEKCNNKLITVGKVYYYDAGDIMIINFPTKYDYKFPSKLEWIEEALKYFVKTYKDNGIKSVAFPLLGCRNGGLSVDKVCKLMEKYLSTIDIDVFICNDTKNPEGKELEMINNFNNFNIDRLSKLLKLTKSQIEILKEKQGKIKRFYEISQCQGIGLSTYKNLFKIIYNNEMAEKNNFQETLF